MMIEELMAEEMEARAARHANMKLAEIAAEYKAIKEASEEAGEVKTALQKISDSYSKHILPARMEEEGIETVRIEGVGRLQTKSDIYCSCPAPNREALQDWLVDHGHGSLISQSVNASTLKAFIKEQMKEGNPVPDDLLDIEPYSMAVIVKV